jgi:uroporphyrinogen-III synthase
MQTVFVDAGPIPEGTRALLFPSRRAVAGLLAGTDLEDVTRRADRPLFAAVGPATARALERAGLSCDLVARDANGAGLAASVAALLPPGQSVCVVRGDLGGETLEPALLEAGFDVRVLVVYRNVEPPIPKLSSFPVAGVLVASPSAGRRLLSALPWIRRAAFVTSGPTTRKVLLDLGVRDVTDSGPRPEAWYDALLALARGAAPASAEGGEHENDTKQSRGGRP